MGTHTHLGPGLVAGTQTRGLQLAAGSLGRSLGPLGLLQKVPRQLCRLQTLLVSLPVCRPQP